MTTTTASLERVGRSVWFDAARVATVHEEVVRAPGPDELTIRAVLSLISQGTELQVYRGQISPETDLGLETCAGTFAFPVKYAYQVMGEVEAVGADVPFAVGDRVFARHPHQDLFTMRFNPDLLFRLPADMGPETAVFANLADVAYNALLDVPVRIGDVVVVFGQGVVGTFIATFARRTAGTLIVVDPLADRRRRGLDRGADLAVHPDEVAAAVAEASAGRGADVVFEASSAPPALQQAIDVAGQEATIAVVSYYGTRPVSLLLAPEFHFRRHHIVSSQVSSMGSGLQPRWDFGRRMDTVLAQLPRMDVGSMITHRFALADAAEAYTFVDTRADETLGVVLEYR
jgi:2-desacetyl-2-hydroxyethyl bacteriochlorophyllide A dehydrogenase